MVKLLIVSTCLFTQFATTALGSLEWNFANGPADLVPSGIINGVAASAVVTPGALSSGWQNTWDLGSDGYWDLGQGGHLVLNISSLPASSSLTTLTIRQWVDSPSLMSGELTVTGAGRIFPEQIRYPDPLSNPTSAFGEWQNFVWQLAPQRGPSEIVITAPDSGALIDRISAGINVAVVPESSTFLAGALLLLPLGLNTIRLVFRKFVG